MTPELKAKALAEMYTHHMILIPVDRPSIEAFVEKLWKRTMQDIEDMHAEHLNAKRSKRRAISEKLLLAATGEFTKGYIEGQLVGAGVEPKTAKEITSTLCSSDFQKI